MSVHDSALDPAALAFARGLLLPPIKRETLWPPLLASGFAAAAALALAFAVLTAPPVMSEHTSPRVAHGAQAPLTEQPAPVTAPPASAAPAKK